MKKLFLIFLFFLCNLYTQAQDIVNDSTMFYGVVLKDNINLKNSPKSYSYSNNYLSKGDAVFIYSFEKSDNLEWYYGVYKDTLKGYLRENEIEIPENFKEYFINNTGGNEIRESLAERNSNFFLLSKIDKEIAKYEKYRKIGLIITEKKFSYAEYGGQFGLKLKFYNGYQKDIKYIEFTIRPYNRVGDKMHDDLGRDVARAKLIGPLESDTSSSIEFDDLFWDDKDVISYLVITYMKVTFMDGTIKEIRDVNKHFSEDIYNGKGE